MRRDEQKDDADSRSRCAPLRALAGAKPWALRDVVLSAVRWIRGTVVVLLAAVLVAASPGPAAAAFPGRNGLLAVAPRDGRGVVLVSADGRGARRICTHVCASAVRPRWSPDGRAIVFANPDIRIVYTDGSCMNCTFGASPNPAFLPSGTVISFVSHRSILLDGIDGIRQQRPPSDGASDAVWAENGWLAIVRNRAIWAGLAGQATNRPDVLKRIGSGTEPSWSSDSRSLAIADDGWIVVLDVRTHRARRLVRGVAPSFSPDGRWIAYIGPRHRLLVVSAVARHPRPRPVGKLTGVSVDWQPLPTSRQRRVRCPTGIANRGKLRGRGRHRPRPGAGSVAGFRRQQASVRRPTWAAFAPTVGSGGSSGCPAGTSTVSDHRQRGGRGPVHRAGVRHGRPALWRRGQHGAGVRPAHRRAAAQARGRARLLPGLDLCGLDQIVLGSDGVSAADLVHEGDTQGVRQLTGIACSPAGGPCVAIDTAGQVVSSDQPLAGAGAWTSAIIGVPPEFASLGAVACPSASLCMVVGGSTVYTSSDPAAGPSAWTPTVLRPTVYLGNVTCPSAAMCIAAGSGIAVSTNPTGGARAWSTVTIAGHQNLGPVLCSSTSRCFITGSDGTVLTSSNPTGGASAWTVSHQTPPFASGSCPTTNLCVAVSGNPPRILTTTDPAAATWTQTPTSDILTSVACPSASLCIAVGAGGALDISTDPATDVWTSTTIDNGQDLASIACPSASMCAAVDSTGHVITTTDPTGGPAAWTPALIDGSSCTDTTPCRVEQLQAADGNGVHAVDSGERPVSAPPLLTGLTLTGDLLSWSHAGTPRTLALTP